MNEDFSGVHRDRSSTVRVLATGTLLRPMEIYLTLWVTIQHYSIRHQAPNTNSLQLENDG